MLYTTRNPREAEKFVDALPFNEQEKEEMKSYFPVLTEFMNEIKGKKGLNSKSGERWFSERILSKVKESEELLARFFSGFQDDTRGMATKFVMLQSTVLTETLKLGKEAGVSAQTLAGIERYCDFMNGLVSKYSGIDDILDQDEDETKTV
jgi:uncharacterized protein YutE (UPF0331/DUF86 family)